MIRQRSAALAALKRLLIAEIFSDPWRHIGPSSAPRMATSFPRTVQQVIKIEDEGNHALGGQASGAQELMDMFRNIAPPVHQPLPPPPPLPAPPPHAPRVKRPAVGPPPGFAGVRQPPQKPPCQRAPAQPHHAPQPAPNAHRAPGTPVPAPAHANQGAAAAAALPLATNTAMAPLQRRSAPPKPRHPAANKKPTVPCGLCGVRCMTARHLKQHEQGRKHRSKAAYLAGEINVRCAVCNVHLSSALNVEQHYAGKQHLRRVNGGA